MGKVEEKKELKKQSLMDAAFSLFTSKGFARTSISDIVQQSGVAKGTFYLYFHDKYDLQDRLISHKAEQLFLHALAHSGYEKQEAPDDKILAILQDVLQELQKDRVLLRFLNRSISWNVFKKAIARSDMEFIPFLQDILHIQDQKLLELMMYSVLEMVGSITYTLLLDGEPVPIEEFKPYLEGMVRYILDDFPIICARQKRSIPALLPQDE